MDQKDDLKTVFEANKDGWNKRTTIHKTSDFYDVPTFLSGKSSLNKLELEEMGDVTGKSLLHLQCHFGLDTLSWAREGAEVTGVDFSETAIDYARELSVESNIPANFVCCNVYDMQQQLHQQFDIVFTSYGVIGWLPDLNKWAALISHFLKPGGTFYLAEFHPVVWMMDESFEKVKYYYHNAETIVEKSKGTYTDRAADISYEEYSWNHSLSEVVNALIRHGLQLQHLNEFPYSCYNCFNNLEQQADGYWTIKGMKYKIPMMYSLKATKL